LERFFADCDRKMEIAKKKLADTQEELSQEATEKVLISDMRRLNCASV